MSNQTIILKDDFQSEYFDVIRYPDGQRSIKLHIHKLDVKHPIYINCRIKTFADLEILSCIIASFKRNDFYINELFFIYLFGIRSDRSFSIGEPNYFKDVVSPIINSWELDNIRLFWPFIPLPLLYKYVNNMEYICYIKNSNFFECYSEVTGAVIKKFNIPFGRDISLGGDNTSQLYHHYGSFKKIRENGNLSVSLEAEEIVHILDSDVIIIEDDLCDGGMTFIKEAEYLRLNGYAGKLILNIMHGLFTNGLEQLLSYFDLIYCTNSYQDIDHPKVIQYKVI